PSRGLLGTRVSHSANPARGALRAVTRRKAMTRRNSVGAARLLWRIAACGGATVAFAIAAPTMASAMGTVWVSPSPVAPHGTSCSSPEFNSIQAAVSASTNKTIRVCAGTYTEQVSIDRQDTLMGEGGATLKLPASPANSTS